MKTLWFDFTNPPHVNFFLPILNHFKKKGFKILCTARDFAETSELLRMRNIAFTKSGRYRGKSKVMKIIGLISREINLLKDIGNYDLSFSSNYEAPLISWLKNKPSIVFDDNDISPNWLYSKFAKFIFSPSAIDKSLMYKMGVKEKQLITYEGFKENIYIADYEPDQAFLNKLPFRNFVTVRPENIFATYVPKGTKSITSDLIDVLIYNGYNLLYLPRYDIDRTYVKKSDKIFIPETPLNGLDVCYYSSAVLTGAGTFSREAALLGTPAVSFFAGDQLLGVDKKMKNENMVYFSRNPIDILNYIKKSKKRDFDRSLSKNIQSELFFKIEEVVSKFY